MTGIMQIQAAHRLTPMQSLMLLHSLANPASEACFVQYSRASTGPSTLSGTAPHGSAQWTGTQRCAPVSPGAGSTNRSRSCSMERNCQ